MSYNLYINDQEYIKGERGIINTEYDLSQNEVVLHGFYYGSGTCINGEGLGWIVNFSHSFENQTVKTIFTNHKRLKLSLYRDDIHLESIYIEYPYFTVKDAMNVNGDWIKKVMFRDLHRWGMPTPIEVSGIVIYVQDKIAKENDDVV